MRQTGPIAPADAIVLHSYGRYCNAFNFAGEVQPNALKKFPDLYKFYNDVASALTTEVDVLDEKNDYWMRNGFDHGKVWLTFMVRNGKLSAFDGAYHPAGEPIALGSIRRGVRSGSGSWRSR